MSGFIKLYREMLKWEWYDDTNTKCLFIHLLLTVNYKDSRYHGHDIPSGSRVSGLPKLSNETGLSVQQVRTAIDKLKSTGEITVKTITKFSIISISKWNEYQDDNRQTNSQVTGEQQASNRRVTTSKEDKKERKKEYNIPPIVPLKAELDFSNLKYADLLKEFALHRKEIKHPLTQKALELAEKALDKIAGGNMEKAKMAIQQSILCGYQGIFEPKQSNTYKNKFNHLYNDEGFPL